jgi:hypothetical protein
MANRLPCLYLGLDVILDVMQFAHHSNKIFRHWDGALCGRLAQYQLDPYNKAPQSFELVYSPDVSTIEAGP